MSRGFVVAIWMGRVVRALANSAREMLWKRRDRENLPMSDVSLTTEGGELPARGVVSGAAQVDLKLILRPAACSQLATGIRAEVTCLLHITQRWTVGETSSLSIPYAFSRDQLTKRKVFCRQDAPRHADNGPILSSTRRTRHERRPLQRRRLGGN